MQPLLQSSFPMAAPPAGGRRGHRFSGRFTQQSGSPRLGGMSGEQETLTW